MKIHATRNFKSHATQPAKSAVTVVKMDALLQIGTSGHVNHEPGSTSSSTFEKLAILFSAAEQVLDCETETIVLRLLLANGVHTLVGCKFMLEGKEIPSSLFSASFKRCALLWKLLFKEGNDCSQRLLLKLDYCQNFMLKIFNEANLDMKLSMGTDNTSSNMFILDFCVSILQGNFA